MASLGGLFGGRKHPNWDRIVQSIQDALGLTVAVPSSDVIEIIDMFTNREMVNFANVQSIEGMQELFRAKSIQALVDQNLHTVALFAAPPEEIERTLRTEHAAIRVMQLAPKPAQTTIVKPQVPSSPIQTGRLAVSAEPLALAVAGFEHLGSFERLCPQVVDLFVKHGQLTSADKDVLKTIKPANSSVEARIAALERWQTEVSRRVRAIVAPKAAHHVAGGNAPQPGDALMRQFNTLIVWMGKLIKAFEATGVRFHNKPVWLPR